MSTLDTIVAQATPPGRGGVGIIRISGSEAVKVAISILGRVPKARYAEYLPFLASDGSIIDEGIALYFPNPNSFTGEDVLELQGHGGPVVQDMLLNRILQLPSLRIARPGEFSERAFLNDKMDLTQAEAIADLIDASSEQAARSAMHSLKGVFSSQIHKLLEALIHLRVYVEAAMDFPEEEIDFFSDGKVAVELTQLLEDLSVVQQAAQQGSLLREGMRVVIAGYPNAGKSSLLNALSGRETAIVTAIPGTTRDVLREHIHIEGMPLHIIDTAGLRDTEDEVERIGIERAWQEIQEADLLLLLTDSNEYKNISSFRIPEEIRLKLPPSLPILQIRNKADLSGEAIGLAETAMDSQITLSARTGEGIDLLRNYLKQKMGFTQSTEGGFLARRRHLEALKQAELFLLQGKEQLVEQGAAEFLAEELRHAQSALNSITGEFTSDDLLGRIFSSFCIGK